MAPIGTSFIGIVLYEYLRDSFTKNPVVFPLPRSITYWNGVTTRVAYFQIDISFHFPKLLVEERKVGGVRSGNRSVEHGPVRDSLMTVIEERGRQVKSRDTVR